MVPCVLCRDDTCVTPVPPSGLLCFQQLVQKGYQTWALTVSARARIVHLVLYHCNLGRAAGGEWSNVPCGQGQQEQRACWELRAAGAGATCMPRELQGQPSASLIGSRPRDRRNSIHRQVVGRSGGGGEGAGTDEGTTTHGVVWSRSNSPGQSGLHAPCQSQPPARSTPPLSRYRWCTPRIVRCDVFGHWLGAYGSQYRPVLR